MSSSQSSGFLLAPPRRRRDRRPRDPHLSRHSLFLRSFQPFQKFHFLLAFLLHFLSRLFYSLLDHRLIIIIIIIAILRFRFAFQSHFHALSISRGLSTMTSA